MHLKPKELEVALEAANAAGENIMGFYNSLEPIKEAPASITTQADRNSQDIILSKLHKFFPNDGFIGEEDTPLYQSLRNKNTGNRLWIVDPIDGTRGFAKKIGEFCIMIALVENGEPIVGVVHDPANGRTTYACKNGGCYSKDRGKSEIQCKVSERLTLAASTVTKTHSRQKGIAEGLSASLGASKVRETYSAGLKLALVARGEADIYVNDYPSYNDWDICAGHILVTEAGGKMSDLNGNSLVYGMPAGSKGPGFIASNGHIHSEALSKLRHHGL